MRIDVWSDIACPWCWLGKHNLEEALRRSGVDAEVGFRSFELQPVRAPTRPARAYLAERFGDLDAVDALHARMQEAGARVGIRYDFARAQVSNTFDAHRLHHLARAHGRGAEAVERFMRAYHGEGEDLADAATLRRLALEVGLPPEEVDRVLASDAYAEAVRAEEDEARRIGVRGVPFFVFDGRFGVSGAQAVEAFAEVLAKAREG